MLVRLQMAEGHVSSYWRLVPNLEHGTLCRAFALDPVRHRFDLPSTAYGNGPARVGAGERNSPVVSGYVLRNEQPAGTVHIAREGERFRDLDPLDQRDLLQLDHTRW